MSETPSPPRRRPGGEIAARPLEFIWLCDCSGSMRGEKIQTLNFAIREALPAMREEARGVPHARVLVRAVAFSDDARWLASEPVELDRFVWTDAVAAGTTDLGAALRLVAAELASPPLPETSLPPVLVLVSDGQPTDDFEAGLAALLAEPAGASAVRIGIAVGADADTETLRRFIGEGGHAPLLADNAADLVRQIKWASTVPLRAASTPATELAAALDASAPVTELAGGADALECW